MTKLGLEKSMPEKTIISTKKSERVACNVNWTVFPNLENTAQFTLQATRSDFFQILNFF